MTVDVAVRARRPVDVPRAAARTWVHRAGRTDHILAGAAPAGDDGRARDVLDHRLAVVRAGGGIAELVEVLGVRVVPREPVPTNRLTKRLSVGVGADDECGFVFGGIAAVQPGRGRVEVRCRKLAERVLNCCVAVVGRDEDGRGVPHAGMRPFRIADAMAGRPDFIFERGTVI